MTEDATELGPHETLSSEHLVPRHPAWLPLDKIPAGLLIALAAAFVVVIGVGAAVPFALGWIDQGDLRGLSYPGIFLANFFGTATVFIPVPGLTAAGQALIVEGPRDLGLNPIGVIIAGASGMTIAETTAYAAGVVAHGVMEERKMPIGGRIGRWMHWTAARVDWLMARYGFATLLVLSAVPNVFFEFAGITAGATRMPMGRFLLAVGIGKTIRVILLVIIGNALLDLIEIR